MILAWGVASLVSVAWVLIDLWASVRAARRLDSLLRLPNRIAHREHSPFVESMKVFSAQEWLAIHEAALADFRAHLRDAKPHLRLD